MKAEALARFLDAFGDACRALAADLRQPVERGPAAGGRSADQSPSVTQTALAHGIRLGLREREILQLFERKGFGIRMTASEVADGIGGYDKANVYFPLRTLTKKGLLDEVSGPVLRWELGGSGATS